VASGYQLRKWQRLSDRGDTKEAIALRVRDNAARALAGKETDEKYPVVTVENAIAAREYFEMRRSAHMNNSEPDSQENRCPICGSKNCQRPNCGSRCS
jgi:hypothetical protein